MPQELLTFSVLFPEDGTEILNLILLCGVPENVYGAMLLFSARGVICVEKNLLKDVLKLIVSEPHQFNFSAVKG